MGPLARADYQALVSQPMTKPSPEALELDASLRVLRLAIGTPLEGIARLAHEMLVRGIKERTK